jgi:hypothetical protein
MENKNKIYRLLFKSLFLFVSGAVLPNILNFSNYNFLNLILVHHLFKDSIKETTKNVKK